MRTHRCTPAQTAGRLLTEAQADGRIPKGAFIFREEGGACWGRLKVLFQVRLTPKELAQICTVLQPIQGQADAELMGSTGTFHIEVTGATCKCGRNPCGPMRHAGGPPK